ncbi:Pol polyprotein [Portunus trituberculatus]|uniref:Pol polyprotein n=1 Tax=Portunus trituberculatus TaxID=210409 RepID=A0A5B7EC47_PORTR|nr:Pol polyprotein [Portunus trituberculatus]
MQLEANIPPLCNRLQATNTTHLHKYIRRENAQALQQKINQSLQQDPALFTKKTWSGNIATGIIELDGSISEGRAAAAFVCNTAVEHYRLQNRSPVLQAKLTAIQGALHHALQKSTSAVIHTDSLAVLHVLNQKHATDNIGLVTSIWSVAHELQRQGMTTHLNWVPSQIGIKGNKDADREARNALNLPNINVTIPTSLSQAKAKLTQPPKKSPTKPYGDG